MTTSTLVPIGLIISVRIYARPLKPQELKQNLIATKLVSNAV